MNNIKDNTIEVVVKYGRNIDYIGQELDAKIEDIGENYAIITLRLEDVPLLYTYKEIEYIEMPKILTEQLYIELQQSCVPSVHDPYYYGLHGNGVIVAIIDSGIDYTHPDFIENGKSRILYLWDQTKVGTPPEGFNYGQEYKNEEINIALESEDPLLIVDEIDVIGHGTAVAGIASGNGNVSGGRQRGVAPKASLVVVKLKRYEKNMVLSSQIMRAIKYVITKAEDLNMPIVINISYGTNDGSHNGDSLFESYINEISSRWKTSIVVAAGNEGASGHHYQGELERNSNVDVTFKMSASVYSFYMTIWKNFVDTFLFQLIAPNGERSVVLSNINKALEWEVEGMKITGLYQQPNYYNQSEEIIFRFDGNSGAMSEGIWTLRVVSNEVVDGKFNIWLPTVEEVTTATAFSNPSNNNTITIPATCQKVISVGGYSISNSSCLSFSGQGTIETLKPDLAAPGNDILTTSTSGGYDTFSGTSVAAPFVTGAVALMMEWGIVLNNDPFLYGQKVKAYLQKGAARETNFDTFSICLGYGRLCLKATMDYLVRYGDVGELND